MGKTLLKAPGATLPEHMARDYIADMLGELAEIARRAGLSDIDAVLSVARLATKPDAG